MEIESKQQILERRKEIEQELVEMLKETESDFTLDHVRDAIFHEEDNDDMMKVVAMFDGSTSLTTGRGGDASELSNVLELVTDAWNYFPHKVLGGISPAEKALVAPGASQDLPVGAFVPFFKLFPKDAEIETREIILTQEAFGLPKGEYLLVENYCTDNACDCRKVMINVVTIVGTMTILGTVGFGWEKAEYYRKWTDDDRLAEKMVGAYIEPGGIQTGVEQECFDLVSETLRDEHYVDRIKKHYKMLKEKIKSVNK